MVVSFEHVDVSDNVGGIFPDSVEELDFLLKALEVSVIDFDD